MEARRRTWFDDRGLVIAGTPDGGAPGAGDAAPRALPFYAGAMHYWRVPPTRWSAALRALHGTGLTLVETYVPWRVHQPEAGTSIWTAERDLGRFLEAAHQAGLGVVLRPGPHVNAELTGAGLPDWVLSEPDCQARTAWGTPAWLPAPPRAFPIPSYASHAFRARVRAWYEAVAEVVRPWLAPGGPVVALGVDNEAQLFFRTGAFDVDYHPDALALWTRTTGIDEPPRRWAPDDAARCARWLAFKDAYLADALGAFAAMLDEVGLGGVARFHNLPVGARVHADARAIQRALGGPVGIDAHLTPGGWGELRRRAAAWVGDAAPLPLALEVGVGFVPWLPPLDSDERRSHERDRLLTLLAAGMRGFNLYMAVERDRHCGAAITSDGKVEAAWVKPLVAALAEVDWPSLRREAALAVVASRADARFGVLTNVIDPVTPALAEALSLGPGGAAELGTDAGAIAARRWHDAIERALERAQIPYEIVDESTPELELARYKAVIAPTFERIDRGLLARLRALAESRRAIVVIGPGTPGRDELDRPLAEALPRRVGKLKEGSLDDLAGLTEDLAALAGEPRDAWQIERPDDVRAFAFSDASRVVRVVFVVSDVPRATTAVLLADGASLRDPLAGETFRIVGGRASLAMPPRGVRMLIVAGS